MNKSGGMLSTASLENIQLMAASRVTINNSRSALCAFCRGTDVIPRRDKRGGDVSIGELFPRRNLRHGYGRMGHHREHRGELLDELVTWLA